MAKVIMTCGKICTGKTTYAQRIREEYKGVILSVDEITLALFGQYAGDEHDTYVVRAEKYLFEKSLEIIGTGINVILDWGFWTASERAEAREFYKKHGIQCELHYLDISDELWEKRLKRRNAAVKEGRTSAYYVDKNLAEKFASIFETPSCEEADLWITAVDN